MSNNLNKNFFINFFIILSIFCLDRLSKIYVINFHEKNYGSDLYSSKFLNISLIWNEGIAFGLFSFSDKFFYHILWQKYGGKFYIFCCSHPEKLAFPIL